MKKGNFCKVYRVIQIENNVIQSLTYGNGKITKVYLVTKIGEKNNTKFYQV